MKRTIRRILAVAALCAAFAAPVWADDAAAVDPAAKKLMAANGLFQHEM